MNARILKPEEWGKVEKSGLPPLLPYVSPENIAVVAVEDDEGKVLACMSVLRVTHFEGAWVDPEHRNAGVVRALLRLASALAAARGEDWVFAGCADENMRGILGRLGGAKVAMDLHALWVGEEGCRQQSQ